MREEGEVYGHKHELKISYIFTHHRFLASCFFSLWCVRITPVVSDSSADGRGCRCQGVCESSCPCRTGFGCESSYVRGERRLKNTVLDVGDLQLCECSDACDCRHWPLSQQCTNRVALLAPVNPTLSLEVFKTDRMGFGVRSLVPVKKGQFVCRYLGQYVSEQVCESMTLEEQKYLWKLHPSPSAVADRTPSEQRQARKNALLLDARVMGNEARFINHHCDPNLLSVQVFRSSLDPRTCEVAIFARKDIQANEEMFLDYHYEPNHSLFRCDCGPSCINASEHNS